MFQLGAAEKVEHLLRIGTKFLYFRRLRKQFSQRRLRCSAQHRRYAIHLHQFPNGPHTGRQIVHRQHLGFVKNDDTIGNIVKLAASRGPVRVERFKKLYAGGNNDRSIPVFRGETQFLCLSVVVPLLVKADIGMIFQHIFRSHDCAKDLSGLFDDAGIGDNIDHTAQPMLDGMLERKRQGRDRLSTPCRNRQAFQSTLPFARL